MTRRRRKIPTTRDTPGYARHLKFFYICYIFFTLEGITFVLFGGYLYNKEQIAIRNQEIYKKATAKGWFDESIKVGLSEIKRFDTKFLKMMTF